MTHSTLAPVGLQAPPDAGTRIDWLDRPQSTPLGFAEQGRARRRFGRWDLGEHLGAIDLAQRGAPASAADLARRDGLVAAGLDVGTVARDRWILPVRGHGDGSIEAGDPRRFVSTGPILDLLTFDPARPERWRLDRGSVAVLGAIEPHWLTPSPVRVHRDPLGWLCADGDGIVLITSCPRERRAILAECRAGIVVDDADFGEALAAAIEAGRPRAPEIFVRSAA